MGGDTPVYNAKNMLEVLLGLSTLAYLLNSNYEKSAKCNPTFLWYKFFSVLQKYRQKKGKDKCNFWIINLCNGGTNDFVELWDYI